MKIIVADDEKLIRYTIISVLEKLDIQNLSVIEAVNGQEMIEKVITFKPDGAFVDIRMPGIDGLKAMEIIKSDHNNIYKKISWFILTGFADFEFARKAIDIGVVNYLLKPVSSEEIKAVVEKMVVLKKKSEVEMMRDREIALIRFSNDMVAEEDIMEFNDLTFHRASIFLNDSLLSGSKVSEMIRYLRTAIENLSDSNVKYTLSFFKDGSCYILESAPDKIIFSKELNGYLKKNGFYNLYKPLTVLLTPVCEGVQPIIKKIETALSLSGNRHFLRGNSFRLLELTDLTEISYREVGVFIEQLAASCQLEAAGQIDKLLLEKPDIDSKTDSNRILIENVKRLFNINEDVFSFQKLVDLIVKKFRYVSCSPRIPVLVQRTLQIVDERFQETIGINEIADLLYVTPNYLSSVFKRVMNIPFTRYLTHKRMEAAKKLLLTDGATVKDVAYKVGYSSSKHFTKLFKKHFFLSPSEYQRQQIF